MSIHLCCHLKEDGLPCGSPALRSQRLCYFHQRHQREQIAFARDRRRADVCDWQLPELRTLSDIQLALHRIMNELFTGRLDVERAGPMLYATQQAAIPLRAPRKRKTRTNKPLRLNILPVSS